MSINTISASYLEMQVEMHKNPGYGVASLSFAPMIATIVKSAGISSISDYGAGKMNLLKGLKEFGITDIDYRPYDPVFPNYGRPLPADLVCCIDVLEHIEYDFLDKVLQELFDITTDVGFFSIHTGPAKKFLSDGRNAHLIQQPASWWLVKICNFFEVIQMQRHEYSGEGFWIIVERKP